MATTYEGGCHCGAIRWSFHSNIPPSQWSVRSCQCSFCRAHGARCTSDPAGSVEFSISDAAALSRYHFALKTAEFLVCARCGVYLGAVVRRSARVFATLNLNSMKTQVENLPEATPVSYDSEGLDARVARRLSKWTPVTSDLRTSKKRGLA
jgi:hypothetical protein